MIIGCRRVPVAVSPEPGAATVFVHVTYARHVCSSEMDVLDYWINPAIAQWLSLAEKTRLYAMAKTRVQASLDVHLEKNPDAVRTWKMVMYG